MKEAGIYLHAANRQYAAVLLADFQKPEESSHRANCG